MIDDHGFTGEVLRQMRACMPATMAEFEAGVAKAKDRGVPPSRAFFKELKAKQRIEDARKRGEDKEALSHLHDVDVYNIPIEQLGRHVPAESVDAIITDPPYNKPGIPTYSALAQFAGRALKVGGSLLALSGNLFLPEIINRVTEDDRLKWNYQLHYVMNGPTPQIHAAKAFSSVKPVLWLTKGPYQGEYINNRITAPPRQTSSNEFHPRGQSIEGMAELLNRFAFPGDTVCDPFVGGGSIAIAAVRQGCKFIGADIDPNAVKITMGRLALERGPPENEAVAARAA